VRKGHGYLTPHLEHHKTILMLAGHRDFRREGGFPKRLDLLLIKPGTKGLKLTGR